MEIREKGRTKKNEFSKKTSCGEEGGKNKEGSVLECSRNEKCEEGLRIS